MTAKQPSLGAPLCLKLLSSAAPLLVEKLKPPARPYIPHQFQLDMSYKKCYIRLAFPTETRMTYLNLNHGTQE